ncbi:MAG: Indole-3-glycerol-phosphate synthase [Verrucomicrobia bacterium]|jgi:indole-3-glycerol phosphate synthase|nr:Indole-3-glycerol-phosphate synthase [Verrucomicrobiota bacterium]
MSRANILDTIVAQKRLEIAELPAHVPTVEEIRAVLAKRGGRRDFVAALRQPRKGKVGLIAEVKKASPSAGIIRADFDAVKIALEYEAAGASCLSVLTDEKFFQGSPEYLKAIRQVVKLPLLRKDFIIDERQIMQAAEWGADCILLIVAILDDDQLKRFRELAEGAGLAALVEVHDEEELQRALATGATFIGVNNRDLKVFKVDLGTTERLATQISGLKTERFLVAESGIHKREDVVRLEACGAQAILVGESLMRERDIKAKVLELLGAGQN